MKQILLFLGLVIGYIGFSQNNPSSMVFADDVFAGKASPQRIGDVLYNMIDDRTGEMVTYKKVTLQPNGNGLDATTVDGIFLRKYNNEYFMLTKDHLTVKDFGAKGDGKTDDYEALQKAITAASRWGRSLYVTEGLYLFSKRLDLGSTLAAIGQGVHSSGVYNTFYTLKLIGDGQQVSILKFTGKDSVCIQATYGSGTMCGGGLYDLMIKGIKGQTTALYIAGRDGFQTYNCSFINHKIGVRMENRFRGEFTEYVVQNNPRFESCEHFLTYSVIGSADNSFHGSGIVGGSGVIDDMDDAPIYIGHGALPYNAPLSMQIWIGADAQHRHKTLINNASGSNAVSFHGNLTTECGYYNNDNSTPHSLASGSAVTYVGTIGSFNQLQAGTAKLTSVALISATTGLPEALDPSPSTYKGVMKKGYLATNISLDRLQKASLFARVSLTRPDGFDVEYLLLISSGQQINNLQTISSTLTNNYSLPTFIMKGGVLQINGKKQDGTPYDADVNVQVNILPLSDAFRQNSSNF